MARDPAVGADQSCRCRRCPRPGAATLDGEADARGASLAYRRLGRQWLRIDLADRLASHAHKVRSAGGDEPVDAALATSVGLDEAAIAKLMEEVGFTRAGEAWQLARPPSAAAGPARSRLPRLCRTGQAQALGAVRIDLYLHRIRLVKSRTSAQGLIETGYVRVDGKRIEKAERAGPRRAASSRCRCTTSVRVLRVLVAAASPRSAAAKRELCYEVS